MDRIEFVNMLIASFEREYKKRDRSGIYAVTSRNLAYNSNKIEGSTLTPDQTAALFDMGCLPSSEDIYRAKDVEEMQGHFMMFNYMIQTINEPLSESMIKQFHYELKSGVFEDRANGYNIGEYKSRPNIAGTMQTSLPADVHTDVKELLEWYQNQEKTLLTMAVFHARYEKIHPFQDGNGRTGRLILFRESLVNHMIPPIIQDKNRMRYMEGIREYSESQQVNRLYELLKEEQANYQELAEFFLAETID